MTTRCHLCRKEGGWTEITDRSKLNSFNVLQAVLALKEPVTIVKFQIFVDMSKTFQPFCDFFQLHDLAISPYKLPQVQISDDKHINDENRPPSIRSICPRFFSWKKESSILLQFVKCVCEIFTELSSASMNIDHIALNGTYHIANKSIGTHLIL